MTSLPIPVFVSLVLVFLVIRGIVAGMPRAFLALLGLCAAQAGLASLNQIADLQLARIFQPILAGLIGPMTWVIFATSTRRAWLRVQDSAHLAAGPILMTVLSAMDAHAVDVALTLWFVGHGTVILWTVARGSDAMPDIPLESADRARTLWIGSGLALLATALVDMIIISVVLLGRPDTIATIVTISSAVVLLCLAVLGVQQSTMVAPPVPTDSAPKPSQDPEESVALFDRLTVLLEKERLYLDPDLNLTRLARRLHVPVKKLSAAINHVTGASVSRLINGYRVAAVCTALQADDATITQAMFACGFSTKSNFNVEFRRVTGQTPSAWLAAQTQP